MKVYYAAGECIIVCGESCSVGETVMWPGLQFKACSCMRKEKKKIPYRIIRYAYNPDMTSLVGHMLDS